MIEYSMDTSSPNPVPATPETQTTGSAAPASNPSPESSVTPSMTTVSSASGGDTIAPEKKGSSRWLFIVLALILLLIGILATAFYFYKDALRREASTMQQKKTTVQRTNNIIIVTDATYPPMEFMDEKGTLVGFDIDLGKQIAEELGTKATFQIYSWDDLFTVLDQKKADMVISSVTITDERKAKYSFSEPYFNAGQVLITKREGSTSATPELIRGKKIGVQKDTTSHSEAKKYTESELVISYDDYVAAAASLSAGLIDAIMVDLTGGKGIVDKNKDFVIASDPLTDEYYGIVMRKDDLELQKAVNVAITSIRQRGVLDTIKQKWFK